MGSAMTEYLQPVLVALLVLLVPATGRMAVNALAKKLDEGRQIAMASADETRMLLQDYQREADERAAQRHRDNVDRFDRIEIQTTSTNGKVAEHDKQLTALAAQNELLIRLFPGPKQPDGGK